MGTGLNVANANGQFVSANPSFTITPTGAAATGTAHQVIVPGDIGSGEGVRVVMPGGKELVFQPLAIDYFDPVDGQGVLLDVVTNAVGWLVASNEIVFSNCFTHIKASIRLRNTRAGLESDLILHESPPEPSVFGLSSSARLEMLTEQLAGPVPTQRPSVLYQERDPVKAASMLEPDLVDTELTYGQMKMGAGRAFLTPTTTNVPPTARSSRVAKSFLDFENRKIIIEAVEHRRVRPALLLLPPATKAVPQAGLAPLMKAERLAKNTRRLPASPTAGETREAALRHQKPQPVQHAQHPRLAAPGDATVQLASASAPAPAFVLDYYLVSIYWETDFTFRGDTTYWVSSGVALYGTTTIEGGTVVKFSENSGLFMFEEGTLVCDTTNHLPAVFTSFDDNSVGEDIGGSGTPASCAIYGFYFTSSSREFRNVRFTHIALPIAMESGGAASDITLRNVQVRDAAYSVFDTGTTTVNVFNGLFVDCGSIYMGNTAFTGEHLTVHNVSELGSGSSATIKNSLLVGVQTNYVGAYTEVASENLGSATGVFQAVEGGGYYLASDAHRNTGTTAIDAQLKAVITNMTTYAPEVLTGTMTTDRTLTARAIRDTGGLDRGYHYPAVDYLARNLTVQNATLKMQNGVVVAGGFNSSSLWSPALRLNPGKLVSQGTATRLNRLLRANQVQENVQQRGYILLQDGQQQSGFYPELTLRYTELSSLAGEAHLLSIVQDARRVEISRSAFVNGQYVTLTLYGGSEQLVGLTNNLFRRVEFGVVGNSPANFYAYNNLFKDGSSGFTGGNANWRINDNVFDHGAVYDDASGAIADKNAYVAGVGPLSFDATPVTLTSLTYASGPLGRYYVSGTTLQNAGSRNADDAGLYHFTTTTSQGKEQASVVDIGLHYAAVGAGNNPTDTDGEGLADYLEDQDGKGLVNSTESSYLLADTDGDKLPDFQELELGYDPLASDTGNTGVLDGDKDFDGDGLSNAGEINVYQSNPGVAKSLNSEVNDGHFKFAASAILFGPSSTEANLVISFPSGGNIRLTLSDVPSGSTYDIYRCTNLIGNSLWDSLWSLHFQGTNAQRVWNFPNANFSAFFMAGSAADTDGDGLTDGYEVLVSHTTVDVADAPRKIYETAVSNQTPSAWFKLNDASLTNAISGQPVTTLTNVSGGAWAPDAFAYGNSAFSFTNGSNVLTAGDVISGGTGTNQGSMSLVFRLFTSPPSGKRYLFSQKGASGSQEFAVFVESNGAPVDPAGLKVLIGGQTVTMSTALVFQAWHYLALTWHETNDVATWHVAPIGGILTTGTINLTNSALVGSISNVYLGNRQNNSGTFTSAFRSPGNGALDQIAFWNRALTNTEVSVQFDRLKALFQGPSKVFDLTRWELTLPVDETNQLNNAHKPLDIGTVGLNSGFKYVDPTSGTQKYFYLSNGSQMVFEAPWNGADQDTNSPATKLGSPRSELRETLANGSEFNWKPYDPATGTMTNTHTLQATCRLESVPSKVIFGQIHADTPNPAGGAVPAVTLFHEGAGTSTKKIKLAVYYSPDRSVTNTGGVQTLDLVSGVNLGDRIDYELKLEATTNGAVTLTATVFTNRTPFVQTVRMNNPADMFYSGWGATNVTLYFKAGCYYPTAATNSGTARVSFSSLGVTHQP